MEKVQRTPLSEARWAELAAQIQDPALPLAIRSARRLELFLREEQIVKFPGEKIPAWRTIPQFPDIYAEGEKEAIWNGKYMHEQGRVTNLASDFEGILAKGLIPRRQTAAANLEKGIGDKDFLQAAIITIDAILEYADRYEIPALSDALRYGAHSFETALQSIRILHFGLWASNVYHNTVGRFDQYMLPYYQADVEKGVLTRASALELLEEFFLSFNRDSDLYTGMQQGDNGQSMMLGGCDRAGNCAVNDLTYLCLDASLHVSRIDPKINLRVDKNTPISLYEKATELTKQGLGFPQYSNDDIVIPALVSYGYDLEDARDYSVAACWEFIVPGVGADIPNIGAVCHAKIADYCIRQFLPQCESFEQLMDHYRRELKAQSAAVAESVKNLFVEPAPYQSVLMRDSIAIGKDISQGGKYNNYGIHGTAFGDGVDQLTAVKDVVFDKKLLTAEEFLSKLEKDFEGDEELLHYLRNDAPKIGRDLSAKPVGEAVLAAYGEALAGIQNERGGIFRAGTGSAMYYVWHAEGMHMLANGHKTEEDFSCNFSPSLLLSKGGPISIVQGFSFENVCHTCNGGPLTLELHDTVFRNEEGSKKVALLVKTFIDLGGHQLQLNAISRETLLDARQHPEKYPNLIVRVWGWSGYFVQLDTMYQDQILARTSYQAV